MERLGKYEIVAKIGVGGFGVVYKGIDPFIKRPVAIKTCSAENVETRERFLREAEIAGNLQHRNIVTIFEFGYQDETPYLVQEFLSGEDLDHKIQRHEDVPLSTKISWLVEIARGLSFAHASGVVHRDVKPANVRVLDDGHVKILDFGIAKLAQTQSNLTQAGVTLGTASYLAPEQIRGELVDARTDVFSFGVLAYELITYEKPFRAQEISALFYKLLNEPAPALAERIADIPAELARIVERCLSKDPGKRFAPTSELLRALERLQPRPISTGIVPRPPIADRTAPMVPAGKTLELPTRARQLATAATLELDQVELRAAPGDALPESRGMAPAGGRPGGRWALLGAAGALIAATLAVGWLARRADTSAARDAIPEAASTRVAARPQPSLPRTTDRAKGPTAPGSLPEEAADKPGRPTGPELKVAAAAEPAKPPPPLAPKPARLTIGPAWDPSMRVQIGDRSLRLDREQSVEVPPGVTVLQFSLVRPEYSAEEPLRIELKPGASERVSIPIELPGRLTVQPHLNARPGHLRLDGQPLGRSPVRSRWVAPGEHFVEIYAEPADAEPSWTQSLTIVSGVESVVTFDLDGRVETILRERPVEQP